MMTVVLPNGDEAEASFEHTFYHTDNGMPDPHYQEYIEVFAYLELLEIYLPSGGIEKLDREDAVACYGEKWVRGIEEFEEEMQG